MRPEKLSWERSPEANSAEADSATLIMVSTMNTSYLTPQKRMWRLAGFLLATILSGCATNPMGLSDQEWNTLPPARQAELRAEQYRIDEERRIRREEETRQRTALAAKQERERLERIEAIRANARYGDVVTVTLHGGTIRDDANNLPCEPTAFDLVRGEQKQIVVRAQQRRGNYTRVVESTLWARLSEDGNTVHFSAFQTSPSIVIANDGTWERGRTYATGNRGIDRIHNLRLDDMTARIRFREATGAPQRVIIEHR